jgi:hypothetical protein
MLSVTGAFVAMKLISDASRIQENILKKELQSKTPSGDANARVCVRLGAEERSTGQHHPSVSGDPD